MEKTYKKGILVVSFGTSYEHTRKANIEAVENRIKEEFEGYEVRRAFTSNKVIKKLRERDNIIVDTPYEALNRMKKDGFEEVTIQPLHIIPGIEYEKIVSVLSEYNGEFKRIVLGRPILYSVNDYKEAVDAFKSQLPSMKEDSAVVLMGHGTYHPSNACYACLQSFFNDEKLNVYVATVEGYPEIDHIIPKLKDKNIKEVTLMPYMLVAGDHAINDMASSEEDSWKSLLEKEGFIVKIYLHGLGENLDYQNIYVNRVREAIEEIN
ncbi:MAG: sirohydrochlorin cobaltochelatase [Anaeromicrobium sp.]|jgi:sirohydrochlorin cobaltochelatase|uniref:sirohydrochlorin cobaltochelatase n=1 Tax=Anaeromicrobium sp. TaxID=1929132 RepID=UPI0025F18E7B|nr:sirohydrochlorin cobaltochelatase [Anaeromicrobium sp.]MCT4594782.1 sirohydrochlorin cobaltochelatase [Anaeromicrobium sp.]